MPQNAILFTYRDIAIAMAIAELHVEFDVVDVSVSRGAFGGSTEDPISDSNISLMLLTITAPSEEPLS